MSRDVALQSFVLLMELSGGWRYFRTLQVHVSYTILINDYTIANIGAREFCLGCPWLAISRKSACHDASRAGVIDDAYHDLP
jgi:hypothetical protein